jgi:hypothetical protein
MPPDWVHVLRHRVYQIQDVQLLDSLYDILLPWFPGSGSVSSRERQDLAEVEKML